MRPADVIAANRSWGAGAVLALFLAACPSPQSLPPAAKPGPRTLLYASNSGTLQAVVFNSTWDESLPVDHLGVPLTTTHPLLALDTAHDEIAVADTQGIRFYPRSLDGPPRAVRTLPWAFKGPLLLAASQEKNWLAVMDLGTSSSSLPQESRHVQVDVYVFALDANGPSRPLWASSWTDLLGAEEVPCRPAIDFARGEIFFCTGKGTIINVYPLAGSGRISPLRSIEVENFAAPCVLELDSQNGLLYAASRFGHVFVYASSASGKVAPLRTLEGIRARALAVDPEHQELVTVSTTENRISVYPSSDSGAAVALRSFLADGAQVVVDPARGEFIVGGDSRLSTYSRQTNEGGTPLRSIWDGGPSAQPVSR